MEQYSPAQRSNRNKSNSPAKSINPVTYNLKPQNEQIWQKQMELENIEKRQNQLQFSSIEQQLQNQLDRLQADMNNHKNKYQQQMDEMRQEAEISFEQQYKMPYRISDPTGQN